jgi:hypothetical protein
MMAIGLVLKDCGTAVPLVPGQGAALTSPIVRDDRGSALLFRCRAFVIRQLFSFQKGCSRRWKW